MRAVLQRVSSARVEVAGSVVGSIDAGLLVLLGVARGDTEQQAEWLARKLVGLRVFNDDEGRFNRSLLDVGGAMLVVSQFTLLGDSSRGTRPSFSQAAAPERAEALYDGFCRVVAEQGVTVARGRFGASMKVSLVNEGPVTIVVERPPDGTDDDTSVA